MQIRRAQKLPQLWNRYAYGVGNPVKYVDPTGRILELTGTEEERKKALIDLRSTVPPELRIFVRTTTTRDGRVILDPRFLNAKGSADSGNFQALRQIANSPGTALFNSSRTSVGSETIGANAFSGGITFSSNQSASGKIEAYVGGDLNARETAETTAHELRHVRRYLLGLPALDELIITTSEVPGGMVMNQRPDPAGPVNLETKSAEQEAARNYDAFAPPFD